MSTVKTEAAEWVRVVQAIKTRAGPLRIQVEGRVLARTRAPTGSWYAHGKGGRLWLDRLRIQKEDGEIVDLVVDADTVVTALAAAASKA